MNLVGRFLLSSRVYHLRARAKPGPVPGDGAGYELIKHPDGSIEVIGDGVTPGSDVVITWPDGSVVVPVVDEDGGWTEISPPGQPDLPTVVVISMNAIQFSDCAFEIFADGSFVMTALSLAIDVIATADGDYEVTDAGEYITFEVEE